MLAHDSDRINEKRNATLAEIDVYLDRITLVMDECPSEYVRTIDLISDAIKDVSSNIQKAKKSVHKAYRCAFSEADVVRSYQTAMDRISPDEPLLTSSEFISVTEAMRKDLYYGKIDAAARKVKKIRKMIGPNTRAPALTFNCLDSHIADDGEITVTVTNNSEKTVTFNGVTPTSSPSSTAFLNQPVLHPRESTEIRIVFAELPAKDIILKISVEYTTDLVPMVQNYPIRLFV